MKSTKQLNKRSLSPFTHKNLQTSQKKKKNQSNYPSNPYRPTKQFDSRIRTDKKRQSNYLKQLLKQSDSGNKYRIVTQPVDDRIMSIVSASFVPHSKTKQHQHSSHKIRNVSNQRKQLEGSCPGCQKYKQELNVIKHEIARIFASKMLWKSGEMGLSKVKQEYGLSQLKSKSKSGFKLADQLVYQIKKHCYDLMKDIQVLSDIDYPKMLSLKVFKFQPHYGLPASNDQTQIKSLLAQVRSHYQGKVTSWDLQTDHQDNDHTQAIMRNLKARLSHSLRQNLQLKARQLVLDKTADISAQSQQYLRNLIEDVLCAYSAKI